MTTDQNRTQEQMKAWWFDRVSEMVLQNMALVSEINALRAQLAQRDEPSARKPNGKDVNTAAPT